MEFARAGHRVFWISPTRCAIQPYEAIRLVENLWEIRLGSIIPNIYSGELTAMGAEQLCQCLEELYQDAGITASGAILQLPFWRPLGIQIRYRLGGKLVYDCMDNWAAFPGFGDFNRLQEAALWKDADLPVVTSDALAERARKAGATGREGISWYCVDAPKFVAAAQASPIFEYWQWNRRKNHRRSIHSPMWWSAMPVFRSRTQIHTAVVVSMALMTAVGISGL